MPSIIRTDFRTIKSTDAERVKQVEDEFWQDSKALDDDFRRMYEAWGAYWSVAGSGWEAKALADMREDGRYPWSFNLCGPKVDTLAGAIVNDMPDLDWVPVEGQHSGSSESVRFSYASDKEVTNWEQALINLIRDGLIHSGWMALGETRKYSPRGNIYLERIEPGMLVPSARWKTDDTADLQVVHRVNYYTAENLAFKYQAQTDAIMRVIEERKRRGYRGTPASSADQQQRYQSEVGDEYLVIEQHWLELVRATRLIGMQRDSGIWVPFPSTKDRDQCLAFGAANDVDMTTAVPTEYEDRIHHVTTICPGLDKTLLLENGKSRIQTKSLPFFNYTVTRYKGQSKGVVQEILDCNRLFNSRISMENEAIAKATGGSDLWNQSLFTNPNDWARFVKEKNKFGKAFQADLDGVQKIREPITNTVNLGEVHAQIGIIFDRLLPLVSRVSDSMSAMAGEQNKSGILFERQFQVNRIGNLVMDKRLKQLLNNVGEAYFYQWQITYGGEPREIADPKGERNVVLNERVPMGMDAAGEVMYGIRNATEFVPRTRVIVVESSKSGTQQVYRRHILNDMLAQLMRNPEGNLAQIQAVFQELVKTMDWPDSTKEAVDQAAQLDAMRVQMKVITDLTGMAAQMKGNAAMAAQYQVQAQSAMAQLGQQMSTMGGGVPGMGMGMGGGGQTPPANAKVGSDIIVPERMMKASRMPAPGAPPAGNEQPVGSLPPRPGKGTEGGSATNQSGM